MDSLEGVTILGLLDCLHNVFVDSECDGSSEECQGGVGHHRDEGDVGQGEKDTHHPTKHHASLLHIAPVDQVNHCKQYI